MFDMMVMAFQTDSTRVATFVMAHEGSNRPYPVIGIKDGHHDLSHHRNQSDKLAKLAQINRYHATTVCLFPGSPQIGEGRKWKPAGQQHGPVRQRLERRQLAPAGKTCRSSSPGRGGGSVSTGRHIQLKSQTPLNNLYLSMLDRMGVPIAPIQQRQHRQAQTIA